MNRIVKVLALVVASLIGDVSAWGQVPNGNMRGPLKTVSTLPSAASSNGVIFLVTDANPDCSTGGGTGRVWCSSNGASWVTSGGSGGGPPTGAAGGALAGTYPNPSLATANSNVGVCGDSTHVSQITLNAGGQATACTAVAIPGVSAATTNPANLLAYALTRTSSTVITCLQYASSTTPHVVTITGNDFHFTSPCTVTITGGSGGDKVWVYVDSGGTLTAGHQTGTLTMTCSSCVQVTGVTGYPEGSSHIGTWTAATTTWDVSGGQNDIATSSVTRVVGAVTWDGTKYTVTGGGGSASCTTYTIPYTSLNTASASQEIPLTTGVAGATGYAQSVILESTQFASTTGLTVSVGRPGGTDAEMFPPFPLMVAGGTSFTAQTPPIPQATTTYDIVANFHVTSGFVNAATAGSVSIKLCSYSM